MPQSLHILPSRALKRAAGECPFLDGKEEEWIACCSERFFPLAKRIAGDDSLAEDALQISWIKILQAINHACFNGPKACPWVGAIVANTARDVRRRRLRHREVPLSKAVGPGAAGLIPADTEREVPLSEAVGPGRSPEALAQEKQLLIMLREIISLLPQTYRQVVELRLYQGLSTGQTAQRLSISSSKVTTRLNRAVRMIQRRIDARTRNASSGRKKL